MVIYQKKGDKDLQEMKRNGINRVFIGHNDFDPYIGGRNVKLMSDDSGKYYIQQ